MVLKIVIGLKNGMSFQKETSKEEAEALYGKVLGETLNGEILGLGGTTFTITGGSDSSGFPMRKDLNGARRKKILLTKGIGFNGKLRGKRFNGLRVKKTIAGNVIYDKTNQINLVCTKGADIIEKTFKKPDEKVDSEKTE